MRKQNLKENKGITLIALVITIIVLLILAGITIGLVTGDNGILTQAQNAKNMTEKASEEEKIQMAVMGSSLTDNGYADVLETDSLTNELESQFGENGYSILEENGDGSFLIAVNDRKYYINDDKTVINSDNIIEIGADKFANFRDDVNAGNTYEGKVVLLTEDVDLQSQEWEPIGFMASNTDTKNPEIEGNKAFKGIFDGGNHTIKNLKVSSTENKFNGLFSFVIDGTIRNITIGTKGENDEVSEVSGSSGAGVVGYLYGFKGNISNCINYANTNGAGIARSIAGQHTIYNCKNYGSINSNSTAGGIIGGSNGIDWQQFANVSNKIINCGNYGEVVSTSATASSAGITGFFKGDVSNCCNKGLISGGIDVGGIVGGLAGGFTIENCYNTKNVKGEKQIGGILGGSNYLEGISNIKNCYSIGEIRGTSYVGDIEGYPENRVDIEIKDNIINCKTKNDTFTAKDLGDAFVDNPDPEKANQPLLYWEKVEKDEGESY